MATPVVVSLRHILAVVVASILCSVICPGMFIVLLH